MKIRRQEKTPRREPKRLQRQEKAFVDGGKGIFVQGPRLLFVDKVQADDEPIAMILRRAARGLVTH